MLTGTLALVLLGLGSQLRRLRAEPVLKGPPVLLLEAHRSGAPLGPMLRRLGVRYREINRDLLDGKLRLSPKQVLIIASLSLRTHALGAALVRERERLAAHVREGGVILALGQDAFDDRELAWLPPPLSATRGEVDYDRARVLKPRHPLFTGAHALNADHLSLGGSRWLGELERAGGDRGVRDAFVGHRNMAVLAARRADGRFPALLEGASGRGRVLLLAGTPERLHATGSRQERSDALRLIARLLDYGWQAAEGRVAVPPASPPATPPEARVEGSVFEDANGDGRAQPGERPLAGVGISDGETVVRTDAAGRFRLTVPADRPVLLSCSLPHGYRPPRGSAEAVPFVRLPAERRHHRVDFGLRPEPQARARARAVVRAAVLADVHVGNRGVAADASSYEQRLREIGAQDPAADLVLVLGDLTEHGRVPEYVAYSETARKLARKGRAAMPPIFHAMGNHDVTQGADPWDRYRRAIGPVNYSFDRGRYHFVVTYGLSDYESQRRWLEQDLAGIGDDREVIVAGHHYPARRVLEQLAQMGTRVRAVLYGHWHANRVATFHPRRDGSSASGEQLLHRGIETIGTAPATFAGIDRSPPGYRIVELPAEPGVPLRSGYRVGGLHRKLDLVFPAAGTRLSAADARRLVVRARAYDTATQELPLRYRIQHIGCQESRRDPACVPREGALEPDGPFTASAAPIALGPGVYRIEVTLRRGSARRGPHGGELARTRVATFVVTEDVPPAATLPVVPASWSQLRGGATHAGYVREPLRAPLELAWVQSTGGLQFAGSPVVMDGRVFLGLRDDDGRGRAGVLALDARTGERLWRFVTDASVANAVAVAGDQVFALDVHGGLYALSAEDGQLRWRHRLEDPGAYWDVAWAYSAPLVVGDRVYSGLAANLVALGVATGVRLFGVSLQPTSFPSSATAAAVGDRLFSGGFLGGLHAIDARTGKKLWSRGKGRMLGSPVADADRVYVASNGRVEARDVRTGALRWQAPLARASNPATPALAGGLLLVGDAEGTLHAFSAHDGQLRWRHRTGRDLVSLAPYRRDGASIVASPVVAGDTVYLGGGDGRLRALDLATGKLRWQASLGLSVAASPAIAGDLLLVATLDGLLHAFRGRTVRRPVAAGAPHKPRIVPLAARAKRPR